MAKKDLLFQVFDNLIGNAVKFSNLNGIIVFRAYEITNKNTSKVRIEIGDSGVGILKIVQKNIFRKFSILNDDLITIYGNGLGLSITKKILENGQTYVRCRPFGLYSTSSTERPSLPRNTLNKSKSIFIFSTNIF